MNIHQFKTVPTFSSPSAYVGYALAVLEHGPDDKRARQLALEALQHAVEIRARRDLQSETAEQTRNTIYGMLFDGLLQAAPILQCELHKLVSAYMKATSPTDKH